MDFEDKTLVCVDCGSEFVFTRDEQELHQKRGYTNEPKRCPSCREAKRRNRPRSGFGGGDDRGNRAAEFHTVTCAECGQQAEVPFKPRGDRPVYCSDCFRKRRGAEPRRTRY